MSQSNGSTRPAPSPAILAAALKSAEADVIGHVKAATDLIDGIGTDNLQDSLAALADAAHRCKLRMAHAAAVVRESLGAALSAVGSLSCELNLDVPLPAKAKAEASIEEDMAAGRTVIFDDVEIKGAARPVFVVDPMPDIKPACTTEHFNALHEQTRRNARRFELHAKRSTGLTGEEQAEYDTLIGTPAAVATVEDEPAKPTAFSVAEAAKFLKVAPRTVRKWRDAGRLSAGLTTEAESIDGASLVAMLIENKMNVPDALAHLLPTS